MDTLYKDLQYYIWCLEMEKNPKLCESKRKYEEFIVSDLVKNHKGDCTLDNFSCSRCQIQDIEIKSTGSNTATVTNNGETLVYARITNTGVPLRGEETAAENNLRLNVRYTDLKGNTIDPAVLDQGTDFISFR